MGRGRCRGDGNKKRAEAQVDLMTPNPLFDLQRKRLRKGRDLSRGHTHDALVVESVLEEGLWFLYLISPPSPNVFPPVCISPDVVCSG